MSEAGTKKKALANFFAKGKAKKAGGAGDDAESPSTAAAPTTKSSSSSSSSAAIAASVGIGGDWDEDSTKVASVLGLNVAAKKDVESIGARLGRVGLADVTEEEMAAALGEYDGEQVDIDAEEAKKALWATLKKSAAKKKAAPAAPEPAAAPAASSTMTFAQQAALRRAGQAAAPLRKGQDLSQALQNTAAFPTLGRAASGLPPGAQFAEAEQSIEQAHKSKNAWAALAGGDDEEEEEEEEEQAPAPAPATAPAKAAPASAAVAAADPFSISEADLVQGSPSAPALKDEAAFVATAKKIMSVSCGYRQACDAFGCLFLPCFACSFQLPSTAHLCVFVVVVVIAIAAGARIVPRHQRGPQAVPGRAQACCWRRVFPVFLASEGVGGRDRECAQR